mgnify:CR=1 FL=1
MFNQFGQIELKIGSNTNLLSEKTFEGRNKAI